MPGRTDPEHPAGPGGELGRHLRLLAARGAHPPGDERCEGEREPQPGGGTAEGPGASAHQGFGTGGGQQRPAGRGEDQEAPGAARAEQGEPLQPIAHGGGHGRREPERDQRDPARAGPRPSRQEPDQCEEEPHGERGVHAFEVVGVAAAHVRPGRGEEGRPGDSARQRLRARPLRAVEPGRVPQDAGEEDLHRFRRPGAGRGQRGVVDPPARAVARQRHGRKQLRGRQRGSEHDPGKGHESAGTGLARGGAHPGQQPRERSEPDQQRAQRGDLSHARQQPEGRAERQHRQSAAPGAAHDRQRSERLQRDPRGREAEVHDVQMPDPPAGRSPPHRAGKGGQGAEAEAAEERVGEEGGEQAVGEGRPPQPVQGRAERQGEQRRREGRRVLRREMRVSGEDTGVPQQKSGVLAQRAVVGRQRGQGEDHAVGRLVVLDRQLDRRWAPRRRPTGVHRKRDPAAQGVGKHQPQVRHQQHRAGEQVRPPAPGPPRAGRRQETSLADAGGALASRGGAGRRRGHAAEVTSARRLSPARRAPARKGPGR
jgi:hypothetical protein